MTVLDAPKAALSPAAHPERAQYERDGYFLAPPVLPPDLLARAVTHMDAVIDRQYETGVEPSTDWRKPGDDPNKLIKIDNPHISDRTLMEVVSHPALGEWAAKLTGGKMIQAWAVQLLFKPSGGQLAGNVGWHQDWQYWTGWWQEGSEVFTAWLALSDVTEDSGPMRFVHGSNHWGFLGNGAFFDPNLDALKEQIPVPAGQEWREVLDVLPAGAPSFHHKLTLHGSGPNTADWPRRSLAIHLRTEKSDVVKGGGYYTENITDPTFAPTLYRE